MELSYISFGGTRVPWNSMEYSMEFHGTRVIWNGALLTPWNPMELGDISFGGTRVPWNSMEYSMKFHGTKLYFIWRYQSSMEFHGIFRGIPWNTCVIWNGAFLMPWNPMDLGDFVYLATSEFHGIPWNIPWNARVTWYWIKWQSQSSMEFHGTKWYFIWRHQSSMEFHGIFREFPWNTCVIWNGALLIAWNPKDRGDFVNCRLQSSMEFHGISHGSAG